MNAFSFGSPGVGFHKHFFGVPLLDILGTIGLGFATSRYFPVSFPIATAGWFVTGELLHYYYGVDTFFLKLLK